jgi:hypothetical protein
MGSLGSKFGLSSLGPACARKVAPRWGGAVVRETGDDVFDVFDVFIIAPLLVLPPRASVARAVGRAPGAAASPAVALRAANIIWREGREGLRGAARCCCGRDEGRFPFRVKNPGFVLESFANGETFTFGFLTSAIRRWKTGGGTGDEGEARCGRFLYTARGSYRSSKNVCVIKKI